MCQEAGCPNIFECWEDREATFLIGGDQCTRRCDFCQIDTGKPQPLDRDEPRRVAESVQTMQLQATPPSPASPATTSRTAVPGCTPRPCAPSTRSTPAPGSRTSSPTSTASPTCSREVFESRPEVLAHNVETVPRIFKRIRPAFRYERSLDVITQARDFGLVTKSNLILGMGETREEVSQALRDLHEAGCELITITQYLRPSPAAPPRRALGQARGVRRAQGRGGRDRLLRGHVGSAGAFVLPGRSAVPSGHGRARHRQRHRLNLSTCHQLPHARLRT